MKNILDLRQCAKLLGGEIDRGRRAIRCPGPGHSRVDRSLAVYLDSNAPDGFRVHSFGGQRFEVCRDYVRLRLGNDSKDAREIRPYRPRPDTLDDELAAVKRRHNAANLWNGATTIKGSAGERYLQHRIGRDDILELLEQPHGVLRFEPRCPTRLENGATVFLPAIIAAMRHVRSDELLGVHRTFIEADGSGKSLCPGLGTPKKMMGIANGAAIKLAPDEDVTTGLGICEGLETGLSLIAAGFRPIWCLGSAGQIQGFEVLRGIEALTIFADRDGNAAGQMAAETCRARWVAKGREAHVLIPKLTVSDFNDLGSGYGR